MLHSDWCIDTDPILYITKLTSFNVGFEILAFPCNQFGEKEPGSNDQILEFVCTRFKSEFPIFNKVIFNPQKMLTLNYSSKKLQCMQWSDLTRRYTLLIFLIFKQQLLIWDGGRYMHMQIFCFSHAQGVVLCLNLLCLLNVLYWSEWWKYSSAVQVLEIGQVGNYRGQYSVELC